MTTYIKAPGSDTWHWCRNCSGFSIYVAERTATRPVERLCDECARLEWSGNCDRGRLSPGRGES
jgi:hypothetical protein